jgi:flagellar biosynthesis protein FliQ
MIECNLGLLMVFSIVGMVFGILVGVMLATAHHQFTTRQHMPDIIQFLDHSERKTIEKMDDFDYATLKKLPRISRFAIDLVFTEHDWRCITKGEIARGEIRAFLSGAHEAAVEWWDQVKEWWIIEHGSFKERNKLAMKKVRDSIIGDDDDEGDL